jgi:hypothetical protein
MLTEKSSLEIMTFLADVLTLYSRFQKKLQSDDITLLDVPKSSEVVRKRLEDILQRPLIGGWTTALLEQVIGSPEGQLSLKGVPLSVKHRRATNNYVPVHRDANAIKNEVIQTLLTYIQQRVDGDDVQLVVTIMEPFVKFKGSANIQAVHNLLCSDLDLQEFAMEFNELVDMPVAEDLRSKSLKEQVKTLATSLHYKNVTIALSRLLAAKPHSADVERLISCSVALKSPGRSVMDVETENMYLYIYFNMPGMTIIYVQTVQYSYDAVTHNDVLVYIYSSVYCLYIVRLSLSLSLFIPALDLWDPRPAIAEWMSAKERRKKECPKVVFRHLLGGSRG